MMANTKPTCTVLAVDDDPQVLRQISDFLKPNFNVLTTRDSQRAIEWLRKDASIVVLIVEQILSSGLGLELLETARNTRPEIRRVLITRYCDLPSIVHGLHNGAIQRTISKPITQAELTAALGAAMHRASA
jgi:DNA-binding NtrC family response regulator